LTFKQFTFLRNVAENLFAHADQETEEAALYLQDKETPDRFCCQTVGLDPPLTDCLIEIT
jgi:hypothetical protein